MGLTFDWSPANPEECRNKCAMDENCHVYQWYLKTLENEEVVGECFLDKGANTYDCSDRHALEGFEVVEGHRKQASSNSITVEPTASPADSIRRLIRRKL